MGFEAYIRSKLFTLIKFSRRAVKYQEEDGTDTRMRDSNYIINE